MKEEEKCRVQNFVLKTHVSVLLSAFVISTIHVNGVRIQEFECKNREHDLNTVVTSINEVPVKEILIGRGRQTVDCENGKQILKLTVKISYNCHLFSLRKR